MNTKELIIGKTYIIGSRGLTLKITDVSETSFKARKQPDNPLRKTVCILHHDTEIKEVE